MYSAGAAHIENTSWSCLWEKHTVVDNYCCGSGDRVSVLAECPSFGRMNVFVEKDLLNGGEVRFDARMESLGWCAATGLTYTENIDKLRQMRAQVTAFVPDTTQPVAQINIAPPGRGGPAADLDVEIDQKDGSSVRPRDICRCCYNADGLAVTHFMFAGRGKNQAIFVQMVVEYADLQRVQVSCGQAFYAGEVVKTYFSENMRF